MKRETIRRKLPQYKLKEMIAPLSHWYGENRRQFAWRETKDPYRVWVSEIMLQQTRISAVIDYYERFMARLPSVEKLAAVSEDELLKLWEGLGYYSRARHLKKAVEQVVTKWNGKIPTRFDDLLTLPGVGRYTAGAIASICADERVPAVDGNVLRVLCRYLACHINVLDPALKQVAEEQLTAVLPEKGSGLFNEAIMELGEVVCLPNGKPLCEKCPLHDTCLAYKTGIEQQLPIRQKKVNRRIERVTVLLLSYQGKVAIVRRSDRGILAGLWGFPVLEDHLTLKKIQDKFPKAESILKLPAHKHVFSHVEWHMIGYKISLWEPLAEYQWVTPEELFHTYPIPTTFRFYQNTLKPFEKKE